VKITKILALTLVLALALTGCKKPNPEVSSIPESSVVESTPESITPVVDGDTYTAYGMQFVMGEGWTVEVSTIYTYVYFDNSQQGFVMFMEPYGIGTMVLNESAVVELVEEVASQLGGECNVGPVTTITVDGKSVWAVQTEVVVNGSTVKMDYWLFKEGSDAYVWVFFGAPDYYAAHIADAQALTNSIIFV
jgi:hypothetical protein